MPRYKLTIAYEGTAYCGWQRQYVGEQLGGEGDADRNEGRDQLPTVQQAVEDAVRKVVREPVHVLGASRTDSGVHAKGQVAAFTCSDGTGMTGGGSGGVEGDEGAAAGETSAPAGERSHGGWPLARGAERLRMAVNSRLPADVLVRSCEAVGAAFNPIGDAVRKQYAYRLYSAAERPLWERNLVHHVRAELDIAKMREAAAELVGEHDFAGFAAAGHGRMTTVRRVFRCDVEEGDRGVWGSRDQGSDVVIRIEGNGFLWNMVRIIAGTLYEAGRGRIDGARVREALR
ncbi:MAG: tRNA pseudouridine synthase A, partial [Phycisphaerales bacterium]|nr:tRNA pseudouridine synthase A [Phycisphaerales bacterium]